MAFVFAERTLETSTSVGLGAMLLDGALSGYQGFSEAVGQGNDTYYTIVNEADDAWEVGIGSYTVGQLNRSTLLASSTGGFVNFAVGTKRVFAAVAAQFFNTVLTLATHGAIDHTGLPGVPAAETFDADAHELVDHTTPPFNLLDLANHGALDHNGPPLNLITDGDHSSIDHTGLPGVNAFDALAHASVLHASIPGIPPAEAFTMAVHALTNHDGIPGIGATPAPDVAVEIAYAEGYSNANTANTSFSININLPGGGNWTVFAWGAWMNTNWPDAFGSSYLRIDGQIVSTIINDVGGDPSGFEYYSHFGARSNLSSGLKNVEVTIPSDSTGSHPRNARVVAVGFRDA
jgi:hypothetical protein